MTVGQIIHSQLKALGLTDLMAWGAEKFMSFESNQLVENSLGGLVFKVNGIRHKGHVMISLNGGDLYDVKIGKLNKGIWVEQKEEKDIFLEDLVVTIDNLIEGFYEKGKEVYKNEKN